MRRIQGKNRYAFPEAVLAHVISVLRHIGISASSVAAILARLDQIAFKQALDEVDALYIRLTGISRGIKEGHI